MLLLPRIVIAKLRNLPDIKILMRDILVLLWKSFIHLVPGVVDLFVVDRKEILVFEMLLDLQFMCVPHFQIPGIVQQATLLFCVLDLLGF